MRIISIEKDKSDIVHIKIKKHNDKKKGHYHGILEDIDGKHLSIGFTRDKFKGKNHPNRALKYDPMERGQTVFMKRQATIDDVKNYKPKIYSGIMFYQDYDKAKEYGQRAKENYYKKKK